MARVTVEDCILKIPNRFDLVLTAGQRARELGLGAQLTVERDNDKNPVVALREIADETIDLDVVKDSLVQRLQKFVPVQESEEEETDILDVEKELALGEDDIFVPETVDVSAAAEAASEEVAEEESAEEEITEEAEESADE